MNYNAEKLRKLSRKKDSLFSETNEASDEVFRLNTNLQRVSDRLRQNFRNDAISLQFVEKTITEKSFSRLHGPIQTDLKNYVQIHTERLYQEGIRDGAAEKAQAVGALFTSCIDFLESKGVKPDAVLPKVIIPRGV